MSGSPPARAALDPRRRRALFRSWHRGMREMDLLLGPFADAEIAGLSDTDLDEFEALMELPDSDLFAWLCGAQATPPEYDTPVLRKLELFHRRDKAIDL